MDLSRLAAPEQILATPRYQVAPHMRAMPLHVGTRGSPLALAQTRNVIARLGEICAPLQGSGTQEHIITTTGDASQASGCRCPSCMRFKTWPISATAKSRSAVRSLMRSSDTPVSS